jgi:hypothetical protein
MAWESVGPGALEMDAINAAANCMQNNRTLGLARAYGFLEPCILPRTIRAWGNGNSEGVRNEESRDSPDIFVWAAANGIALRCFRADDLCRYLEAI